MKKALKVTAVVLFVIFIAAAMTSCDNKTEEDKKDGINIGIPENPEADAEESADDGLIRDNVPELDFGGYKYRVLMESAGARDGVNVYPETQESEVLNDTIYRRNQKIQERFNVIFDVTVLPEGSGLLNKITNYVQAGSDDYDMQLLMDRDAQTAASRNFLYPIQNVPHINLSMPYWLEEINKQLAINGKLYWAFSDEMITLFESINILYFNKQMTQDLGFEDLYGLVNIGEWTLDKFFDYAKMGIKDINGDGKMAADDIWGIASEHDKFFPSFWIAAGINTVDKDENDMPYFSVPGNIKFFDIAQKAINNIDTNKSGIFVNSVSMKLPGGQGTDARIEFFKSGNALFSAGSLQEMIKLRDMPDDFGVLPFPKYNAQQSRYYVRLEGGRAFVIPATNQRPEIAGAVMETMACETRNTVYPAYYEYALKNKYSRDPDTVDMLDLIRDSTVYDLGDTIWYAAVREPLTNIFTSGKDTFASWVEKNEEKINKNISDLVDAILNAD